jgi:hypothetical protein
MNGRDLHWKNCRARGRTGYKTMTLEAGELMRRFLLHVLPGGFQRIRHYRSLANRCSGTTRRPYVPCCTIQQVCLSIPWQG